MIIRAKLETVEAGISTIEEQFLADIVAPHGSTVGVGRVGSSASLALAATR